MGDAREVLKGVELIHAEMRRTGENQAALARRCELTPATMSRICAGIRRPDFDAAHKIKIGLGVPLDAWFEPASKSFQRRFVQAA